LIKEKTMTLSRRFTLAMAIVALALFFAEDAKSDEPKVIPPVPDSISVIPDTDPVVDDRGPAAPIEVVSIQQHHAMNGIVYVSPAAEADSAEYLRIYNSIPFRRAEYKANPNYRHDSAMEILTGNARHQTVINHNFEHKQPVKRIPQPARPSRVLTPVSGFFMFSPLWYNRLW
jgi:hypothetical protein